MWRMDGVRDLVTVHMFLLDGKELLAGPCVVIGVGGVRRSDGGLRGSG